ncbi:hypothetical protein JCM16303_004466 [Sporobolomyces ruberrimus]
MSRHSATSSRPPSARSGASSTPRQGSVNIDSGPTRTVRWGSNKVVQQSQYSPDGSVRRRKRGESANEESEEGEAIEGITLAISLIRGKLGCTYYDPNENKIYFLEDQPDSSEFDLTALVLGQLLPTTVLTASNADPKFVSFLESALSTLPPLSSASSAASLQSSSASALSGLPTRLEIRPAREFYAGQGRHLLSQLDIREGPWYSVKGEEDEPVSNRNDAVDGDAMRRNRELRLSSFINGLEKSPVTLGCAGSLVSSITRMRTAEGDLEANDFEISGLELMKLDKVMQINAEALTSLQIFEEEAHASMHATRGKEGLSIFNIVNLTRSPLGSALIRQWLIRPSLELQVIEERQETVACFLRPENLAASDAIRSNLKSIKNANKALLAILHGRGKLREWTTIYAALYYSIMIHDSAISLAGTRKIRIVRRLQDALDSRAFREVGQTMNEVIDWETSTVQKGKVCVRPGIDSTLDELRRQLEGLPSLLSRIANGFSRQLSGEAVEEISVVYFPQLGYLVRVQPPVSLETLEEALGTTFDFQFGSENAGYYKNEQCRDLDAHLGDLQSLVAVQALLEQVEEIEGSLKATTQVLAELDCLLALAEAARDNDWNCPRMTEDRVCKVQGGRHPLAELCTNEFVKNDVELIGGKGIDWDELSGKDMRQRREANKNEKSMIIVAGANMSGKSVYLKQIALITYLAHIGSFVPVDQALIGLTDRIMTRVSTKESITKGSSAFMIDLQQISYMLRNTTPRSLLIIDEFGKGTDSNDGAGLFCGVIETLLKLGSDTPRIAVATHFQSVFANGLLSRQLPVHLAHMEVLVHDTTSSIGTTYTSSRVSADGDSNSLSSLRTKRAVESLTYLYRLAPGLLIDSHAAACAQLFDIPRHVVERARFVTDAITRFDLESILNDQSDEMDEAEAELERLAERFVEWDLGEMESGRDGVDAEEVKGRLMELLE